jgi:DNA primase
MARIPEAEVERLKREVNLVALVEASGVKLRRQSKDWIGLCDGHDDREPSLVVSPETDPPLWHCLGACQTGGSAIDWVMRHERVGFREAVVRLQQLVGGGAIADDSAPPTTSPAADVASEPPVLASWMDDRQLWDATVRYYHQTLLGAPPALEYLDRRGLLLPELLARFEVGYADGTLCRRMPPRMSRPGQRFRARTIELGIMRPKTGQEHMHGRLVVPTRDESDLVVGLYGRLLRGSGREDVTPKHLYLPGPRRGVLNWRSLLEHKEVILCESAIDAMTFWAAGYHNVTTSWGANGFTEEHLATFRRHGIRRVLIAYDRDEAGDNGAAKVAEQLLAEGIECFRVLFPRGMDANEYAGKVKPAEKSLGLAIRQAQWMGKGKPPTRVLAFAVSPAAAVAAIAPEQIDTGAEAAEPAPVVVGDESTPPLGELLARSAAEEKLAPFLAAAPAAAPAASPAPPAPVCDVPIERHGDEVVLWLADRRYRVRGLAKNLSHDLLKINLLVSRGEALHVDTLDLYSARQRVPYVKQAAAELGIAEDVVRHDLQRVLLRLELLQRESIEAALRPKAEQPTMTDAEREEALALARDPQLISRILEDFHRCGVVGEETNKLVGYLAAVSRKLERPLAVTIQSSSAAGKSALMESVLAFVPEEERVKYSAMTGQSLFYMSEQDLRHKVLALVEEEGAERAAYALKLLQSEGELTIASTGKDPQSGRLVTHEYRVEGPVSILLTTTAIEIDEELLNRCLVLSVDEGREQTRAIHALQREEETLEGYWARQERRRILVRHHNFQRLLRPLVVVNPLAPELSFQDGQTRTRRDHKKYLTLIRTIALLHQHQRALRRDSRGGAEVEVLDVLPEDVELATRLAHELLGRSLDELAPQTRRLLELLHAHVGEQCEELGIEQCAYRFLLREARSWTGFGHTQLKVHMARLVDLEYAVVHRGGRGQSFVYELVYAGEGVDGSRFVPGLVDLERSLRRSTGERSGHNGGWSAPEAQRSGVSRGRIGPESGGSRAVDSLDNHSGNNNLSTLNGKAAEVSLLEPKAKRRPPSRPS